MKPTVVGVSSAATNAACLRSVRAAVDDSVSMKLPIAPKYASCRRNIGVTSPLLHTFML